MFDYRSYTVEDLATDDFFRRWVLDPDPESITFWNHWITENPSNASRAGMARELVISIHELYRDDLSDESVKHETDEIVRLARLADDRRGRIAGVAALRIFWRVAAGIVLAILIGWMVISKKPAAEKLSQTQVKPVPANAMIVRSNNSGSEMTVLLSDNSVATLAKGSEISFPSEFEAGERKVYLKGEAFFDVSKNPERPFLVFTNETVTKVLGTSFRVKAFENDNTVLVLVKTGRVSVYPKKQYEKLSKDKELAVSGVVLDPNQQAVFIIDQNRLEKSIVANPNLLVESAVPRELVFDDRPVAEVFKALEKIYGIVITYDPGTLANCLISAQFSDENLKQRLNAISQAIGASYEMVDGQVVISSKGCN